MFNYWHNYRYYFKIFNRLLSLDKGNAKCFSLNKSAILNILWKQNVFYFFHQFIGFNPGGNAESLSGPFPSIPTSKGSGTVDWGMSIENLTAWKMNALSFVLSQMNPRQPTYQNRSRMANPEKQSLASKWGIYIWSPRNKVKLNTLKSINHIQNIPNYDLLTPIFLTLAPSRS